MIRVSQIKLPADHGAAQLEEKIRKLLRLAPKQKFTWKIAKRSLDARRKPDVFYVYTVDVTADGEERICRRVNSNNIMLTKEAPYAIRKAEAHDNSGNPKCRPLVVGAGPAGLFCAYALGLAGLAPVVAERGRPVEERQADVERFWRTGVLNPSSNVQFGEGGAGTFSDGKLNTLVKDPKGRNRFVLETFVKFGAPEEILYDAKPHIGTDILTDVVRNMRKAMEAMGVTFLFDTCFVDYRTEGGKLTAAGLRHGDVDRGDVTEWLETDCMVLAVGHSARDTFRMLAGRGELRMEAKSFAVGLRVEHPQAQMNQLQYGSRYADLLPAAPYKVTARASDGRGVYSFCMCPGGYVVNASSEEGRLAVNGMSYAGRDGANANSAIIVAVTPKDFAVGAGMQGDAGSLLGAGIQPDAGSLGGRGAADPLAGVRYQEHLERRAYEIGGGRIPQQLFGDFQADRPSVSCGSFESARRGAGAWCNLRGLFSTDIENAFLEGMHRFGRVLTGFDRADAILSGVESRTSSPVRIVRDERLMAAVRGIYPCGEGAGYAGGIMSAAMDGLKVAEAVSHPHK